MTRCISIVSIAALLVCGGCSRDFKEVKLKLYGLILPGKTASDINVVAKYIWEGGGPLREIAKVTIDYDDNTITLTPYGLLDQRDGLFPADIFWRTDTVSLGILPVGSYTIVLVGDSFTYCDTLDIPTDAPDSLFQFDITLKSMTHGAAAPNVPLVLDITAPYDTTLRDTTGISGNVLFIHANIVADSVVYYLYCEGIMGVYMHFSETVAKLGIPEVITAGLFPTTPP